MIRTSINARDTENGDIMISSDEGFPVIYAGRGSYSSRLTIWSYHDISPTEEVHLIYIGRYTSIGGNLSIYCDLNHDYKSVYMGVIKEYAHKAGSSSFRECQGQVDRRTPHKGMAVIGNDVWIGNDVTILSDVVIGNGAVIGAGSVVAHDIPPYTICCGNPAVPVGKRFSDDLIEGMQQISWWDFSPQKLVKIEQDMKGEVDLFVHKYRAMSADHRANYERKKLFGVRADSCVMLTFIDIDTDYPVFCNVLEEFCALPGDDNVTLVICYYRDIEENLEIIRSVSELVSPFDTDRIILLGIDSGEDEDVICHADCLILGRDITYISRISHAFKYGIKLISGVNKPIFPQIKINKN